MEIPSSPATPRNTNPSHAVRRSFTAPSKSKSSPSSISAIRDVAAEGAETLFAHHACRIVSFNSSSRAWRRHSSYANRGYELSTEPVGILPWASATETTISTGVVYQTDHESLKLIRGVLGPLRIYRVRGSVAFLNSGTTLRPILAKSQCWCVDGVSKFVIPIGDHSYYRIELPNQHPEDRNAIEEFKEVLEKILKYEKTPCPFKRGFTVELPEPPETPVRLRPWKPRERPQTQSGSPQRQPHDHMMKAAESLDFEDLESLETSSNDTVTEASRHFDLETNYAENSSADTIHNITTDYMEEPGHDLRTSRKASQRYAAISENLPPAPKHEAGRTVTAPPHLEFQAKSSIKSTATISVPSILPSKLENESVSLPSSIDSFHSFHSPISPLPPSPPYSNPSSPSPKLENGCGFIVPRTRAHQYDLSETMVSSENPGVWDLSKDEGAHTDTATMPKTPTLVNDDASQSEDTWPDVETPSPLTQLRQRRSRSRRSTQSPLPSPVNLYSPSCQISGHHLTTAILQKTCSLLLGPPVQLVALMLNIASKIAKGTFRGAAYSYSSESGQRIPCSWNFSDSEDDAEPSWEEDDFGVSLSSGIQGTRPEPKEELGGTWEID